MREASTPGPGAEVPDAGGAGGLNKKLHSWQRNTSLSCEDFLSSLSNRVEWHRRHRNAAYLLKILKGRTDFKRGPSLLISGYDSVIEAVKEAGVIEARRAPKPDSPRCVKQCGKCCL